MERIRVVVLSRRSEEQGADFFRRHFFNFQLVENDPDIGVARGQFKRSKRFAAAFTGLDAPNQFNDLGAGFGF